MDALLLPNQDRPARWPARALAGSGLLLASSGGAWWAWDADPGWGKTLSVVGLLAFVAGLLASRRFVRPAWAIATVAVMLALLGCYEMWHAIATILSQGAAHPA